MVGLGRRALQVIGEALDLYFVGGDIADRRPGAGAEQRQGADSQ